MYAKRDTRAQDDSVLQATDAGSLRMLACEVDDAANVQGSFMRCNAEW
jgi:hypothetical protein